MNKYRIIGVLAVLLALGGLTYAQIPGVAGPIVANGSNNGAGGGGATATSFVNFLAPTATTIAQATQNLLMNTYGNFSVTLSTAGGNLFFASPTPGITYKIRFLQDATGSRPIPTISPSVKWAGGSAPTLTTTASAWDIAVCYYDGTNFSCDIEKAFGP